MAIDSSVAVRELLGWSHAQIEPVLREVVAELQPDLARVCGYHLGWLNADGSPASQVAKGKALRPAMVLLAARSRGSGPTAAVRAAAAVELVHQWSLLHDDIIDKDDVRRGRSSGWAVYRVGMALLAGDALQQAAAHCLLAAGERGAASTPLLLSTVARLTEGQAAELGLSARDPAEVGISDYVDVAERKTGALLGCSLGLGARFAGADETVVRTLTRAGHLLGIAWQAANDIEDIWADTAVTGKPARGDLREHKPTLPLITALQTGTPAAHTLAKAVAKDRPWPTPGALAELIDQAGGRTAAQEFSRRHLHQALNLVDDAGLGLELATTLKTLFRYIVTRT